MLLSSEIILYEKVPSTAHNTVKGRSFQTLLCSRNMLPSISSHSVISQDLIKLICTALSMTFLNEIGFFFFFFFLSLLVYSSQNCIYQVLPVPLVLLPGVHDKVPAASAFAPAVQTSTLGKGR